MPIAVLHNPRLAKAEVQATVDSFAARSRHAFDVFSTGIRREKSLNCATLGLIELAVSLGEDRSEPKPKNERFSIATELAMMFADPSLGHRNPLLRSLVDSAIETLHQREGIVPHWIVAAPGRVNLIGEHIDYNDGFVLPMAIERYVVIAAAPAKDSTQSSFYSADLQQEFQIPINQKIQTSEIAWSNYVRGVLAGWAERGNQIPAIQAVVRSDVPIGGGLSSSAALEVAIATLLEAVSNSPLDPIEKALLAQKAEHDFAGVPCGIMDQFSSVMCTENSLMLLDCRDQTVQQIPLNSTDVSVLITNSNVKHELTGGEYATRRAQCDSALAKIGQTSWRNVTPEMVESFRDKLTKTEFRRARHVVSEIDRTVAAAKAVGNSDWKQFGRLMYESHDSLRDDFEVSCEELDRLVTIACELDRSHGVIGSRMTGGGFGGCTVTLVQSDLAETTSKKINELYHQQSGIEPSSFVTRPARGAHQIEIRNPHQEKV